MCTSTDVTVSHFGAMFTYDFEKKGKKGPKEVLQTLFILFANKNIASSGDDIIRYGNKFRIFFFKKILLRVFKHLPVDVPTPPFALLQPYKGH